MTAPLLRKNKKTIQEMSLRTSAYQLLNAIDDNNIEQVETSMNEILKGNVPEVSIRLFYNYARTTESEKVCEYLNLVLVATYNISKLKV